MLVEVILGLVFGMGFFAGYQAAPEPGDVEKPKQELSASLNSSE